MELMSKRNAIDKSITKRHGSVDQATINKLIQMLNNDDGIIRHQTHHTLLELENLP